MSKNGSIKESILSIYLKENPNLLSEALGFDVENLSLEQRHANLNIDLQGTDKQRRIGIFVEIQLTKSNESYLERIKRMMERYPESVIIWIAGSFDDHLLESLSTWMEENDKKYIDFYAVALNPAIHPVLVKLNEMYKLDIYNHFYLLDKINEPLNVYFTKKQLHPQHCGQMHTTPLPIDYNRPQDVKRALINVLREKVPQCLNLHYDKKMNQNDRILTIGAGKSGVTYRCSAKSVRSLAFVELFFDESRTDLYESFKCIEDDIRSTIHPDITFGKRRIGVYFKSKANCKDDYEKVFKKIADIFRQFIEGFSPYLLGNKEIVSSSRDDLTITNKQSVQVSISFPEQPFPTEESYRIQMEELSEQLAFIM